MNASISPSSAAASSASRRPCKLLEQRPGLRIAVLEKEPRLATHQSGHNSGVVHAGLYYAPGSLKAHAVPRGQGGRSRRYAEAHDIPIRYPGKLVVALTDDELPRLATIAERATANGVDGLEEVGPERIRELEPKAAGIRGAVVAADRHRRLPGRGPRLRRRPARRRAWRSTPVAR